MSTYSWRKNFTATFSDQEKLVRGKLAFKTKETHWIDSKEPVVILVSTHSAFHEGIGGDLKMNALISTIKAHVHGTISVLFCDRAHMHTISLKYENNCALALKECTERAHALKDRYQSYLERCTVLDWHAYIYQDEFFSPSLTAVKHSYENDSLFQDILHKDAEAAYTGERMQKFSNKPLFIKMTKEDIFEQCACLIVLANKGYRFQFYPGDPCASTEYVNATLIASGKRVSWIDVFLTIEKKTIVPQNQIRAAM